MIAFVQKSAKNLLKFAMQTYAFKSGRKQGLDTLSSASEILYHRALADLPIILRTELDERYQHEPKRVVQLDLQEDGLYCAEIAYNLEGKELEQKNIWVFIDRDDPIRLTGIVTGKQEKQRFKIFVKKDSKMYFEKSIDEISIYKL